MRKKLVTWLLASVLALGTLTGCGGQEGTSVESQQASASQTEGG